MKPVSSIPDLKNSEAFKIVEGAIDRYNTHQSFVIGITGAGGAGKTTFGKNIMKYYGQESCISIDLDDYVISRKERELLKVTGYNPKANKLSQARANIIDLANRKKIRKPVYDHSTGTVLGEEEVSPKELIVIEGVTTLYKELKNLNNVSFFLDALEETQIKSRIERDVNQRGYTVEEAMALFEKVKPDYALFIEPTKKLAKVIFEVGTDYIMKPTYISNEFK